MEINNISDLKNNIRGLDFLHVNDGNDESQEIIVLNNFFLDERNISNYIDFQSFNIGLEEFSSLCDRKMKNSLADYIYYINLLIVDKKINIRTLEQIINQLEYFKKHVETRFLRTLSEQNLNRYYQVFQAFIFFEINFFIRRTKEKIQEIKEINALKFEIFKDDTNYYKFETYIHMYLQNDNFHPEYSFLYRKLIENKIIEKINHKDFADYLLKLEFINKTQHGLFMDRMSWLTLSKSITFDRVSNFNKIFSVE
ncbi:hypothetical protein [Empedobacter brevis]|uniref:hypothetical protein n=1 Tax=Empedobacter brevis TaxID=247 RepID=UPI002FDFE9D1